MHPPSTHVHLLVVDDDDLIIQSIRMCVPEQWRVTSANSRKDLKWSKARSTLPNF